MYTLRLQSLIGNLDTTSKDILKAYHEDQQKLRSLTKYPECLKNIRSALSCRNYHDFASFKFPDLDTNITSNKEGSFYRFVKYILWDYSPNHFENQYQDIRFEWCEVSMKSRKTMQSTSSSNPDGTGYSTNTGIMDDERVIFEASSDHPQRWLLQIVKFNITTTVTTTAAYGLRTKTGGCATYIWRYPKEYESINLDHLSQSLQILECTLLNSLVTN
ncbi:hypothetical protein BDC45DRAFT_573690 [Circinella umbellata]|nr:hypothetical protein BDC45DRAFT_573690 [Circinella umbellata]